MQREVWEVGVVEGRKLVANPLHASTRLSHAAIFFGSGDSPLLRHSAPLIDDADEVSLNDVSRPTWWFWLSAIGLDRRRIDLPQVSIDCFEVGKLETRGSERSSWRVRARESPIGLIILACSRRGMMT
jgi:hypothetical protein